METRIATVADVGQIARAHMRYLGTEKSDFTALGPRVVELFYRNAIARGLGTVIVATEDGRIGGFVLMTTDVNAVFTKALLDGARDVAAFAVRVNPAGAALAMWRKIASGTARLPRVAEVVYLVVDDDFRGMSLGGTLIDAGEAWLAGTGARRYELNCHDRNAAAMRLYVAHGLRVTRTYVKAGETIHTMAKNI